MDVITVITYPHHKLDADWANLLLVKDATGGIKSTPYAASVVYYKRVVTRLYCGT